MQESLDAEMPILPKHSSRFGRNYEAPADAPDPLALSPREHGAASAIDARKVGSSLLLPVYVHTSKRRNISRRIISASKS
jgi:hypothetical protein